MFVIMLFSLASALLYFIRMSVFQRAQHLTRYIISCSNFLSCHLIGFSFKTLSLPIAGVLLVGLISHLTPEGLIIYMFPQCVLVGLRSQIGLIMLYSFEYELEILITLIPHSAISWTEKPGRSYNLG